jgi:hypothetical protein
MTLKPLKTQVYEPAAPKAAKAKEIEVIRIDGDAAIMFVTTADKIKLLEADKARYEISLKIRGVKEVTEICAAHPDQPVSSVRLVDDAGGMVTVTLKAAYAATTEATAVTLFNSLEQDPNDFVQFAIKPKFNEKIFYREDGTFNERVYKAVRLAYTKVVNALVEAGELPVGTVAMTEDKVVTVKPDFHQRRWALGLAANKAIQESIPAQVAIRAG